MSSTTGLRSLATVLERYKPRTNTIHRYSIHHTPFNHCGMFVSINLLINIYNVIVVFFLLSTVVGVLCPFSIRFGRILHIIYD